MKVIKNYKYIVAITIGLICFILVFTTFIQINTIEQTNLANISTMRETELREELSKWNAKYEELYVKYEQDSIKHQEYKNSLGTNDETRALLEEELKETNMLLGLTDVSGDGIVVILSDNSTKQIEAYDLLKLVNELRLAGAEAISINGERIVSNSEIVDINYSFIVVNGNRLSSPYTVQAIGNQTYLESGLTAKEYGYMDNTIKGNGKTATLERRNNIKISKFSGNIKMEYIK